MKPLMTSSVRFVAPLLICWPLLPGCRDQTGEPRLPDVAAADADALRVRIQAFCGACHPLPRAESFPKDAWYEEVRRGYNFYYESGRSDLDPPPPADVVRFFREQAPVRLVLPTTPPADSPTTVRFDRTDLAPPLGSGQERVSLAVSFLDVHPTPEPGAAGLVISDMRLSQVFEGTLGEPGSVDVLTPAANPAAVRRCDLDGDGRLEWLVAELGSLLPEDHDRGGVLWLRELSAGAAQPVALAGGFGRVADVSAGDFNGDAKEDLVVAEFGWHKTGSIRLMLNQGLGPDGIPRFETVQLDDRAGAIHVPTCDLNQDGRLDFIALVSQEFEVVEAFLGNGDGTFQTQRIDDAGDPSFGSSGIHVVDLDADGDLDVLATNGDSFDSQYIKPYHGIRWLENQGQFPFSAKPLTPMPGVHRALTADLDLDGDLDVAACAFLPSEMRGDVPERGLDSVIWLEQRAQGQFVRHAIEQNHLTHAAMVVHDLNSDDRPDIVVGTFGDGPAGRTPLASVFWNRGASP